MGPFRNHAMIQRIFTARKAGAFKGFGVRQRVWILLLVGASAVLIWTSMYVAFTPPGADTISGVQGRYFLPLFWPLYLLLSRTGQDGGKLESGGLLCYYLLIVPSCVLAALSVYLYAVRPFCL